jgi:hypothetical protein
MVLPIQECVGISCNGQGEESVRIRIYRFTARRGGFGGAGCSMAGTVVGSNSCVFLGESSLLGESDSLEEVGLVEGSMRAVSGE